MPQSTLPVLPKNIALVLFVVFFQFPLKEAVAEPFNFYATTDPASLITGPMPGPGGTLYDVGFEGMVNESIGLTVSHSRQFLVGILTDKKESAPRYEYPSWNFGLVKRLSQMPGFSVSSDITYGTLTESHFYHDSSRDTVSQKKGLIGARLKLDYAFRERILSPKFTAGVFWASGNMWKGLKRVNGFIFLQVGGKISPFQRSSSP